MSLTVEEVMAKLESMGSGQTRKTFVRHGAKELYGVKVSDLKTLVKDVKKDQELARALYDTGNSDAMYLAGLTNNWTWMKSEQPSTSERSRKRARRGKRKKHAFVEW